MSKDTGNPNWETVLMIREYQSTLEFNMLMDAASIDDHHITLCVRKQPQGHLSCFLSKQMKIYSRHCNQYFSALAA